jgi:hypothetical protein
MSVKCDVHSNEQPRDKKKRKVMFLLENMGVLGKLDRGLRIAVVKCHCGVNREKLERSIKAIVPSSVKVCK